MQPSIKYLEWNGKLTVGSEERFVMLFAETKPLTVPWLDDLAAQSCRNWLIIS